jgi:ABC-2 type transport system permease protein
MSTLKNRTFNFPDSLVPSLRVEFQKVRRSKTLWITTLAFSLVTFISGLFMYIMQDPDRARRFGLVGAKAQVFGGSADWPSYFNLGILMLSTGGLIVFGFIFVWIFGREFSDKTVYDILSLPVPRVTIVIAKMITAAYWSLALVVMVFILMMGIGGILQLPGWSMTTVLNGLRLLLVTGALTILLSAPFALIASITRGYLPAAGCIFLALVLGQVASQLGYGQYFPWTIPMFYSGAAEALTGKTATPLGWASYILVVLVSILSLAIAGAWWRNADQT